MSAEHVLNVGTSVGKLVQDGGHDQLSRKLDVSQRGTEACPYQCHQRVHVADMQTAVVRSERYPGPQTTVVCQQFPLLTDVRQATQVSLSHVAEHVKQGLVRQVVDCFLNRYLQVTVIYMFCSPAFGRATQ